MLLPNKCQHVLCTGNLGSFASSDNELYEYLRTLSPNVHCVSGDTTQFMFGHEYPSKIPSFPESKVLQMGDFRYVFIFNYSHAYLNSMTVRYQQTVHTFSESLIIIIIIITCK